MKAKELKDGLRDLQTGTLTLIDAYYCQQELAAFLQDEHTLIDFQPQWRRSFPHRFPLAIRIFEGKAFVVEDFSAAGIPRYAELVSVSDKRVEDMLSEAQKFINVTLPHSKRQVAEMTFDAIRNDRFYVFTHAKIMPGVEARFAAVLAGTDPADPYATRPDAKPAHA